MPFSMKFYQRQLLEGDESAAPLCNGLPNGVRAPRFGGHQRPKTERTGLGILRRAHADAIG
ncbi:MAG: hypothetical protein ACI9DC_001698 [Gammaproteobacteria bacterium]|jgi:hypothetical protein